MLNTANLLDSFFIPDAISALADEVAEFRVANRRALRDANLLSIVRSLEAELRGQAIAAGSLISQQVLDALESQVKELRNAVEELDKLLDEITNIRATVERIDGAVNLIANVLSAARGILLS